MPADRGKIDVCLTTTEPDGTESLALGYLASALRKAGHRPHVVTFHDWAQLPEAAERIRSLGAPLTGVSMPSGEAAIDALALVHRLRELGCGGHVTCGGTFATLCRKRLLDSYPALDSVIRHDGELPMVMLADALAAGKPLENLPGLTTRGGDGAPAPVDDETFKRLLPERRFFKRYGGVPSAKLSAVRGCWARCSYCGLAALRKQKIMEARNGGKKAGSVHGEGVGGMRPRSVAAVADEMAWLYHSHGVRFFHFVDENHLPPDPDDALEAVRRLDEELSRRKVGRRAVSMMLRADSATEEVVEALGHLGLVRSLLGVDSMDPVNLGLLGRKGSAEVSRRAIEAMTRRNISFHFNLLFVHPYSTIDMIAREVKALRGLGGGLLDPFQVEIFEGTELFRRLERQGRLRGGPIMWFHELDDPEAAGFADLFSLVKRRGMGRVPVTSFAYEVLGMLAMARHFGTLRKGGGAIEERAARLVRRHNEFWSDTLEEILGMAGSRGREGAGNLLERTRSRAAGLAVGFRELEMRIEDASTRSLKSEIRLPHAAVAASLAAALLAGGCFSSSAGNVSLDGAEDAVELVEDREAEETAGDACTPEDGEHEHFLVKEKGVEAGCARIETLCGPPESAFQYRFVLDDEGHVTDMERDDGGAIPEEIKSCYIDAVRGQVFPCLAEYPFWDLCVILLA